MFKKIFFGILFTSTSMTITPFLTNENGHINPLNQENNKIVFDIIRNLTFANPTNGSSLKNGAAMSTVLPLLWNSIDNSKTQAKKAAEKIPIIGAKLVVLIQNLNSENLTLVDDTQILQIGENITIVNLKIAESSFEMPMFIKNVA